VSNGDFTGRLLDGERVVWSGQPGQGLRFTGRDLMLIPFSLLWGGFAVFWEVSVLQHSPPVFFPLFGAAFVLAGLYLVAGRFVVDAWLRSKTRYAVTNRRILIARAAPFGSFVALYLDRLPDVAMTENSGGRGTLRFGPATPIWGYGRRGGFAVWTPSLDPTPQFIAIDNPQNVFNQIQRSIQGAARN
jgi:hypothetical protein